jgi:hypothetical protein
MFSDENMSEEMRRLFKNNDVTDMSSQDTDDEYDIDIVQELNSEKAGQHKKSHNKDNLLNFRRINT